MKSKSWSAVLVLLGLVVGFTVGNGGVERQTIAQAPAAGGAAASMPVGRYQIFAYGTGAAGATRGCYMVDTTTGVMWHVPQDATGGVPKKIVHQLQ